MKPYFEQGGVTIYHGACVDVLGTMPPRSVGLFILDPPYTEKTHAGARTNKRRLNNDGSKPKHHQIDFAPLTDKMVDAAFLAIARVASRWIVATVAFEHAGQLSTSPPDGARFIRGGVWVKVAPMPQMIGDRPGQGWESVAILHADTESMRWNGGARSAVWIHRPEMHGEYPTQKPEPLINEFLADFGEPGDLVCDPFMGSGTTLLCAWKRGHNAIGCDIREKACEIAAKRIDQAMRQGRLDIPRPAPRRSDQSSLF